MIEASAFVEPEAQFELYESLLGLKEWQEIDKLPIKETEPPILAAIVEKFWTAAALGSPAVVCIDSSPFYPAMGGQNSLPQTILVSTHDISDDTKYHREVFNVYFSNALQTIDAEIFMFFHPVLTGYHKIGGLIPGHGSIVNLSKKVRKNKNSTEIFARAYDWIIGRYHARDASEGIANARGLETNDITTGCHSVTLYTGTVAALKLPDTSDYSVFVDRYFLRDNEGRPALDSGDAFQAMNAAYHLRLSERLATLHPEMAGNTSFLSMFPVNLVPPEPGRDGPAKGIPLAYRGGCWSYVSVCGPVDSSTQRRLRRAMRSMNRELWFVLSTEYNRRAADAIASLERWSARGSMLHQLPSDFHSMGVTIAEMRKLVPQVEEPLRSRLIKEMTRLDVFLVQGMFLGAVTRQRRLHELPHDLASALRSGVTEETVRAIFERLIESVSMQRVAADQRWPERGWKLENRPTRAQLEEAASRVSLEFGIEAAIVPGRGLFPLLLVVLRNAYQHALMWALLYQGERGSVTVQATVAGKRETLSISNTGVPPQAAPERFTTQHGTSDDLRVFADLTEAWQVIETSEGQYASFSSATSLWTTSIIRDTGATERDLERLA